ncbi:hypothetical protein PAALTS15_00685 [Paenibacillus alvei TS-15]|jgi:hypothetical protein|uniref:Uncharacterized protein n=1 Tax=Paenibacillus alvei TS-15 TaxID=1117108 RepID=S9SUA0_PAEAL|nr:hypothetical protein [Paenibacillus alvei]EPY09362.1 hypothetical protein PAALTS15_00685 [Paenibacillus alvei TS-15]
MAKHGLLLEHMSIGINAGVNTIKFQFSLYDNDVKIAWYNFKCFDTDAITTSDNFQDLRSTILQGPESVDDIPDRETDALLITVSDAPSTWPLEEYPVRLFLGGVLVAEWNVTFKVPMSPFSLSGTWTQMG